MGIVFDREGRGQRWWGTTKLSMLDAQLDRAVEDGKSRDVKDTEAGTARGEASLM